MTAPAFTRSDLARADVKVLRDGHFANAIVSRVALDGRVWTVKDFAARSWFVRMFLAPFLLGRELSILARLKGVDGIAGDSFRIDRSAIAVEYQEGRSMGDAPESEITVEFLAAFEKLLEEMHRRGVVHLDARGTGNVLIRPDGSPALIDFQASLCTGWMPGRLRRLLEDIDMSGALKKWREYHADAMGERRRKELERIDRLRRFWIFKGYFGLRKRRRRN